MDDKPFLAVDRPALDWIFAGSEWIIKDDEHPGRYTSPIEEYPGYVQFPAPMMLNHFRAYWEQVIEPLKKLTEVEWQTWQKPLDGALMLIAEYGDWQIEGIKIGDVRDGNAPLAIAEWLPVISRDYILPQLDPKQRRVVSTVI